MKALFLLCLSFSCVTAQAASYQWAPLERFRMDPGLGAEFERIESGRVELDLEKGMVRVWLRRSAGGTRCLPKPIFIQLPIESVKQDACGVPNYVARTSASVEGGRVEMLVVKDNTKSQCVAILPLAQTEVRYETIEGTDDIGPAQMTRSRFEGRALTEEKEGKPGESQHSCG